MSKRADEHHRGQSSTVPTVVFSSAFRDALTPVVTASPATDDDDGSSLQSLHIAADDDATPQSSPAPDESPDSTVPQFHYDPEEPSPRHSDSSPRHSLSATHAIPASSTPTLHSNSATSADSHPQPHSEALSTSAADAPRHRSVASLTQPISVTLSSPVALASSSSSPPVIAALQQPTAQSVPPVQATTARSSLEAKSALTCRVVSCVERAEREGYCLPHHKLFKPATAAVAEESSEQQHKREKRERKSREQQLAALKERSSTMPSPGSSHNASTASASASSNLHPTAAAHSTATHGSASSSSTSASPGWFGRRKLSSEVKEGRTGNVGGSGSSGAAGHEVESEDGAVVGDALLVETRRAWRLANKVVSKDVPRLAKRMSVIDDKRVCVLWGRTVQADEVDRATKPRPSVSASLSQQQALAEEEQLAAAADPSQQQSPRDDEKQLHAADPPSPVSRVKGKEVLESELPEIGTWQAIANVVLAVAQHLEPPDTLARTREHFHRVALTLTPHSDLEAPLSDVLNQSLGLSSATFAVFRATHQSILFPAVYSLKTQLYTQVGAMRDVRRHDGWQVEIYIGDGRVWITHVRREQSMDADDSVTHFEVEWEIRLSFDRAMEECRAVILRIQDLSFHAQMPRERKQQIVQVLKSCIV